MNETARRILFAELERERENAKMDGSRLAECQRLVDEAQDRLQQMVQMIAGRNRRIADLTEALR